MSVFFYSRKDTFLHQMDPRAKLACLLLLFTASAAASSFTALCLIAASLLLLFFASKSFGSLARMGPLFAVIGLMTFLLWMLFYEGKDVLISLGPVVIYKGAAKCSAINTLRFISMLLSGLLYLSVASLEDLSDAMILSGVPYKVAFTVSLSFRLVLIFVSTGYTIVEAQKVRGNNAEKGGVLKRINAYVPLLIPLIINGIKKAETLTYALESKGFSPDNKIDIRDKHSMKITDAAVMLLLLAAAVAAIAAGR
jgi:energy-coupling factor transport system permease protein